MSELDDLSLANSYAFWVRFFSRPEYKHHVSKLEIEGYKWPDDYQVWMAMLNGRSCPFCHSQGYKYIETMEIDGTQVNKIYCLCSVLEYQAEEFSFGSFYRPTILKDFQLWGNKEIKENTQINLAAIRDFMSTPIGWRYIYGGFGSGKTMMLHALKTRFKGLALYLTMDELSQLFFDAIGNHTVGDTVREIAESAILLIDDFGAEYPNPYLYANLYSVINKRYARKLPIVFTSNLSFSELKGSSITDMKRILDRVTDTSLTTVIVSMQASYRQREW